MGRGVMYAGQVVKIEYLKVKFEYLKVKFEWLKGQRSVQHSEDIRVNEYTPRECTSACKARGFLKPRAPSSIAAVGDEGTPELSFMLNVV